MTIYLFTYETKNFPSEHKVFTSLQAAKNYLYKRIWEFITCYTEEEEYQALHDFVKNAVIYDEKIDDTVYCFESGDGSCYYIEELELEE